MPTAFSVGVGAGRGQGNFLILGWEKEGEQQVGKRDDDVESKQENYYITILPEGFETLHQERRGQMNTIMMEHFNSILFHKSGPANKPHTYQSLNQPCYQ